MKNYMNIRAFTLVELAIVIVIIGLLVGGVLAGQELIKQAKIRAQIKQLQEYDASVAIFKSKYGFLPGDLHSTLVTRFGFEGPTVISDPYKGDGKIVTNSAWDESYYFFIQMYQAKLIKDHLRWVGSTYDVGVIFPRAKFSEGGVAGVTEPGGGLGYFLGPVSRAGAVTGIHNWEANSATPALMPEQAWNMDMKLDNGNPQTGIVRTVQATNYLPQDTSVGTGSCHGAVNTEYNLASTELLCRITVRSAVN